MKALELLELANQAYPGDGLREFYIHGQDLADVLKDLEEDELDDLYNCEGSGDPLADAIVCALLDAYKCNPPASDVEMLLTAMDNLAHQNDQLHAVYHHLSQRREEILKGGAHA